MEYTFGSGVPKANSVVKEKTSTHNATDIMGLPILTGRSWEVTCPKEAKFCRLTVQP